MTPEQITAARALADGAPQYIIWKQSAYYRPNSQGYTTSVIQAGRYTLDEAVSITHPNGPDGPRDGMRYVHEDEVIDADWNAYQALAARAEAAEAREAALLAANETERQTLIRHNAAHAAQVADLTAKLETMRTALTPFANCADELDHETAAGGEEWPDAEWAKFRLLVSDYRRARDATNAFTPDPTTLVAAARFRARAGHDNCCPARINPAEICTCGHYDLCAAIKAWGT